MRRPLPLIIGTAEFAESETVGLADTVEDLIEEEIALSDTDSLIADPLAATSVTVCIWL